MLDWVHLSLPFQGEEQVISTSLYRLSRFPLPLGQNHDLLSCSSCFLSSWCRLYSHSPEMIQRINPLPLLPTPARRRLPANAHEHTHRTHYQTHRSVENIHAVLGNLRSLKLRGNLIKGTSGLEKLFSLEDVSLSDNRIEDLKEAARLSTLPMLRRVWLSGNPVEAE